MNTPRTTFRKPEIRGRVFQSMLEDKNNQKMNRDNSFLDFLLMKGFECHCAFDVGAFRGDWTQWALRKWPQLPIYMVEPNPESHTHLNDLCQKHQNLHLIPVAAGKGSRTSEIAIGDSLSDSSMSPPPEKKSDDSDHHQVETMTLDDIVKRYETPIPDIVKIDIAADELDVLSGADSLLGKTQVFILKCSFSHSPGDDEPFFLKIAQFMALHEYYAFDISGLHRRSKIQNSAQQIDLIFVHRKSTLWRP